MARTWKHVKAAKFHLGLLSDRFEDLPMQKDSILNQQRKHYTKKSERLEAKQAVKRGLMEVDELEHDRAMRMAYWNEGPDE